MEQTLNDPEGWKTEANAVIQDIGPHTKFIEISPFIASDNRVIYLNIVTLENKHYTVELSSAGFRVVGNDLNVKDIDDERFYETPYSLLRVISQEFSTSFGNKLLMQLEKLVEK